MDHWLQCSAKSFSIDLSHVQIRSTASSNTLLQLKVSFWKTILFLCCQMVHVKATHQHFHLVHFIPPTFPFPCYRKWSLGFCGNAPTKLIQDNDSHHKGRILLQLKNKWAASSSLLLQNGHNMSFTSTCLLLKLNFVGNLSLISLHATLMILVGS